MARATVGKMSISGIGVHVRNSYFARAWTLYHVYSIILLNNNVLRMLGMHAFAFSGLFCPPFESVFIEIAGHKQSFQ